MNGEDFNLTAGTKMADNISFVDSSILNPLESQATLFLLAITYEKLHNSSSPIGH